MGASDFSNGAADGVRTPFAAGCLNPLDFEIAGIFVESNRASDDAQYTSIK